MMRLYMAGMLLLYGLAGQPVLAQDMMGLEQSSLLTRPLFDPSRRGKILQQSHDELPVVTGVVGDHGGWTAIFAGTPHTLGGLSVHAGGTFEGWTVVAVSPLEVRLERMGVLRRIVPKSEYSSGHPQVEIRN
ncbi:hypothetical protein [Neokomagataea anthophila]|uniref:Uncharacterized protein n=1 Tax=Neokomagataea anthophila TaxID=2826925 RepID=A0ABS5E9V9_9PROT|nr:hypothetical protein [Neokomagataea anthophila]MBR0560581.1 hypothetical protein [Neokomagataea anthophila]